jgi:hypothetical protein
MASKKKPGPKPEIFKVELPFDEAVKVALKTTPSPKKERPRRPPN